VRVAHFQRYKLLPRVFRLLSGCRGLDHCPVTDTDQTEDTNVAFGNAKDVVLKKRACRPWITQNILEPATRHHTEREKTYPTWRVGEQVLHPEC
jgi:hypothetical protein